jgi:hypothetical protein
VVDKLPVGKVKSGRSGRLRCTDGDIIEGTTYILPDVAGSKEAFVTNIEMVVSCDADGIPTGDPFFMVRLKDSEGQGHVFEYLGR